jgi:hypothetical protein
MKKNLILLGILPFLIPFNFAYATVNLDPNDPNFTGYPDGGSAFDAQCINSIDNFYVYFSKSDTAPQDTGGAVACTDYSHWFNWSAFFDQWYREGGAIYLLEVAPTTDCTGLSYNDCINYTPPPPPPATTTATTTGQLFIGGFTYGEVLEILILLMIFTLLFFSELRKWLFGYRIDGTTKIKSDKDL